MGRADVSHGRRLVRKSRARRSPADDFVAQQKCAANATGVLSYFRTYYVVFVRSYCLHVRHGTRLTPRGRRKKFRVDRDRQYLAAYPSLAPVSLRGAPHGSPQVLSRWCVFSSRFHASPSFSLAVAAVLPYFLHILPEIDTLRSTRVQYVFLHPDWNAGVMTSPPRRAALASRG